MNVSGRLADCQNGNRRTSPCSHLSKWWRETSNALKSDKKLLDLIIHLEKDLVKVIDVATWKYQNLKSQSAWKIFEGQFPKNAIYVSMDVASLYTNIPQEEGLNTVCKAYEAF